MAWLPIVSFLAVMLTALALVPAGAHLFALPNKIGLDSARYFTVQGIYRGWSMFGFILLGALVANLALSLLLCRRPVPFALALAGIGSTLRYLLDLVLKLPTSRINDHGKSN